MLETICGWEKYVKGIEGDLIGFTYPKYPTSIYVSQAYLKKTRYPNFPADPSEAFQSLNMSNKKNTLTTIWLVNEDLLVYNCEF